MLGWLAVLSGLGAVAIGARWWRQRVDALGRATPKPWFSAGILTAVCVVTGTLQLRHHLLEKRLSGVASTLAGRDVRVQCQGLAGAIIDANVEPGYVPWGPDGPGRETVLKPDVCKTLATYDRSPSARPTRQQVVAVHILTHEAMHLSGIKDEAETECAAVQRDAETARLLGATPREAAILALRYWLVVYPDMPSDYRTSACGPGGPLDELRPDAPWLDEALRAGAT